MALEQFDVRRIRDGVTYNTDVSELLAYAEGGDEETGASRWRAGLFRAPSSAYFAVRKESRRYFDQIGGRWTEGAHVSLDVVDYAAALKWCEEHDANILVDFTIEAAAKSSVEETFVAEEAVQEVAEEAVVEQTPAEEAPAAPAMESAPAEPVAEPVPAEPVVAAEEPSAVTVSISGDQKTAIELEAQKAGMTLDAYLLHCVEISRAALEASSAQDQVVLQEACEPGLDESIDQTLIEIELEEAAPELAACHDCGQLPVEDELALIEVTPVAVCETGALVLTVAEETDIEAAAHETPYSAEVVPMSVELLRHQELAQRAAQARQLVNEQNELGQAAE